MAERDWAIIVARDDKHQVEEHVDHSGKGEEVQGPLGVALRPEDSGAKVVYQIGGHPEEVDAQIDGGQVDNIGGGGHPLQQLPDHNGAEEHHGDSADQRQGHSGVDAAAHLVVPPGAQVPGHHHVGAYRQPHKQVNHQINQRRVGAHRRQGLLAGKPAHHHHVGGVEQQLQQAGGHQRQGEEQYFIRQRPIAHVDAVTFFQSSDSPLKKLNFSLKAILLQEKWGSLVLK